MFNLQIHPPVSVDGKNDDGFDLGVVDVTLWWPPMKFPELPFGLPDGMKMWEEFGLIYKSYSILHDVGLLPMEEVRRLVYVKDGAPVHQGLYGPPLPTNKIARGFYTNIGNGRLSLVVDFLDQFLGRFHRNIQVRIMLLMALAILVILDISSFCSGNFQV